MNRLVNYFTTTLKEVTMLNFKAALLFATLACWHGRAAEQGPSPPPPNHTIILVCSTYPQHPCVCKEYMYPVTIIHRIMYPVTSHLIPPRCKLLPAFLGGKIKVVIDADTAMLSRIKVPPPSCLLSVFVHICMYVICMSVCV